MRTSKLQEQAIRLADGLSGGESAAIVCLVTTEPPEDSASEQRWGEFTRLILPATTALREHVGIDEGTFRTHTFHGFLREFFLWPALDEAMKACVFVMKLDGLLDGELPRPDPAEAHPADRAIEALLLEEDHLRVRRLCEVLVQLVLFAKQDRRELYTHFLLLEDLVRAAAYNSELVDFHGAGGTQWTRPLRELHSESVAKAGNASSN